MNRFLIRYIVPMLALIPLAPVVSAQGMSDDQIVSYVKSGVSSGKSERQIGKELLAKGVTVEQLERLKEKYEDSQGSQVDITNPTVAAANTGRERTSKDKVSPGSLDVVKREVETRGKNTVAARRIYGHKIFTNPALTFEPNENIATPQNYRLGPGDEVIIDIWGVNEDHIRQTISPEGSIMISQIGPLYLNGMNISEANKYVRDAFANKYAGISGQNPDSDIKVTLGNVRTIQVDIMGEVAVPGTYRLSPFATVFHALYKAGGINDIGTMRNVEVIRNGRKLTGIDVYEFLFDGKQTGNIRLQEGDVIHVAPYTRLVGIDGNVKRPMYYEMLPNETVADIIEYAGGFTGDAYSDQVRLARQSGRENELHNVNSTEFSTYLLEDGDIVSVGTILDRYANRVEIKGQVFRPGMYAISDEIKTVGDLIRKAEGLMEDAYTTRVLLYRESPDLSLQIMPIDLGALLAGNEPDITLKRNDLLVIPSIHELEDRGAITIGGLVAHPGKYPFAENITIEDLIIQAGGLLRGASTARIDVSRRINDSKSLTPSNTTAKLYSFSLKDGFVVDGDKGFLLEPYDIVEVRKSPGYQEQRRVAIGGEVAFDGAYTLEAKNERLSDLIRRAGGVNPSAYLKGASLLRQMSKDEVNARNQVMKFAMQNSHGEDSISVGKVLNSDRYSIGIELEKALKNPGSDYDLVLKEGDVLFIPELNNTVKISGDVMFPNTVVFKTGEKAKYYINQAGGYGSQANKGKAFVIYMNGTVARLKRNTAIEPGCHIIIPSKHKTQINWPAIMSVTSMAGTLGTMAAAIATLAK